MDKIKKQRLDEIISDKFELDLKEAQSLIRIGKVLVDSEKIILPSLKFSPNCNFELLEQKRYVSRGAYKLLKAIQEFKIDINDKVCVDIGASTGGFVQVLLEHKAQKIYAVDVGTNQLDYSLQIDKRVKNYEKTNLKSLDNTYFDEDIDIITTDVSFISLKYVFIVAKDILKPQKFLVALIKPQFEASSKYVSAGGYVEEQYHDFLIKRVEEYANESGFKLLKITKSPILGQKSKNIEYISLFIKE
ncbi:TlyA family RNA methyltransferase [[Mycoplasma] gypis]|uniref:TlyA family RNA methyltransferase n=1 Tax=[Mycoplasma] gypis TaxID=92404 RepID=A0ABZ2RPW3_9BACT|nr:TlyA family RNA methyltransferase [[Mycoplasma] gypis]MBN0919162.1 TlyA family RNA methyltransferase [[Mycoplasma] gypis]